MEKDSEVQKYRKIHRSISNELFFISIQCTKTNDLLFLQKKNNDRTIERTYILITNKLNI